VYFSLLCIGQERPYDDDSMEVYSLDKKIPAAAVADKEFDRPVRLGHCKLLTARAETAQSTNFLYPPFAL
jgi:hypothetical protein